MQSRSKVVVTGGAGLVGSACCKLFAELGHDVISIDNYSRGAFWSGASTRPTMDSLLSRYDNITNVAVGVTATSVRDVLVDADVVIHTAAQPSHPYSVDHPAEDFHVNAYGTFNLLECARYVCPDAVFITCSSNKVYGDYPNTIKYKELPTRYEYATDEYIFLPPGLSPQGITEDLPIDQSMHTPFGVSKVVADLYTQEYGRLYGMRTGVFRMGCITGAGAKAVEQHNWIPYFLRVNLEHGPLEIFGYGGKQVRDIIHATDLAKLFLEFVRNPHPGGVYNVGGGYANSISLLEAIARIQAMTGIEYESIVFSSGRDGDHRVYYTDLSRVRSHYDWDISISLDDIFLDVYHGLGGV